VKTLVVVLLCPAAGRLWGHHGPQPQRRGSVRGPRAAVLHPRPRGVHGSVDEVRSGYPLLHDGHGKLTPDEERIWLDMQEQHMERQTAALDQREARAAGESSRRSVVVASKEPKIETCEHAERSAPHGSSGTAPNLVQL